MPTTLYTRPLNQRGSRLNRQTLANAFVMRALYTHIHTHSIWSASVVNLSHYPPGTYARSELTGDTLHTCSAGVAVRFRIAECSGCAFAIRFAWHLECAVGLDIVRSRCAIVPGY